MDHPHPLRFLYRAAMSGLVGLALAGCGASSSDDAALAPAAQSEPIDLSAAPWADGKQPHRITELTPWPSLLFAPGVDYQEALQAVFVAQVERRGSVAAATLEAPLPREVVYVAPDAPDQGLRLALTAPWGWDESGAIRPPSLGFPKDSSIDEVSAAIAAARAAGVAMPEGATMDVPVLEECQIAHGDPASRPAC